MLKLVGLGVSLVSYEPAAFGRLSVETLIGVYVLIKAFPSRLRAAEC